MTETNVSIGQVKRDISELVNRVVYGKERVILTSRGKPKAALISLEDYEQLHQADRAARLARWKEGLARIEQLSAEILQRRQGEFIDVERILQASRADLEARNDYLFEH